MPQRADCLPAVSHGCLLEMEGGRRLWEPLNPMAYPCLRDRELVERWVCLVWFNFFSSHFCSASFAYCVFFQASPSPFPPPPLFFFKFSSLCWRLLPNSQMSLPHLIPPHCIFLSSFVLDCLCPGAKKGKGKDTISVWNTGASEREKGRQAGRQSCQPGRARPNPQEYAARLEHMGFTTSITLAVPCRVAMVLPALHGTSLQKCCFWHLLPRGNEMGVRDGPKPPVVPA